MQTLGGQLGLAALACLCVLLVNSGALRAESEAAQKEVPALPAAAPTILQSQGDEASQAPAEVAKKDEPAAAVESSLSAKKDVELAEELSAPKDNSKDSVSASAVEAKPADPAASPPQQTSSQQAVKEMKDLKSLLESKNDAENDLGPSPVGSSPPIEPKAERPPPPTIKTQFGGEASPAEADKPIDDRFHYSIGEKPLEGKREEPVPAEEKPKVEESVKPAAAAPSDGELEEPTGKKDAGESEDDEKLDSEPMPTATSAKAPASTTTSAPTTMQAPSTTTSTQRPVSVVTKLGEEIPTTTTTSSTKAQPPVESTKKPAAAAQAKQPEVAASDSAKKDSNSSSTTVSEVSQTTTTTTTTTSSPASTPLAGKSDAQEKPAAASGSVSSFATAAAAAAGSSLGSAVSSAIGSAITGKEKPLEKKPEVVAAPVPSPSPSSSTSTTTNSPTTSTTTTTRAPGSRRKSTTDRWNRWQPSGPPSTSEAPPARRRPVLPSIRRRFRPYNRFSPFPWAPSGPEVYSPFGQPEEPALNAEAEPDFGRPSVSKTTSRPRRRSTTELPPWKSSTGRPRAGLPESADDDEEPLTPSVSTRRHPSSEGSSSSGRRPSTSNRFPDYDWNQPAGGGMPEPSESSDSERGSHRPGQRRHQHHNRHHQHHHHRPRHDERPYLSEPSLFNAARPQSPGFGLFNSAASGSSQTGSGFDLLNPFSWVDEITKPLRPSFHGQSRPGFGESGRPLGGGGGHSHIGQPARPSGNPIPVEGEYNNGPRPGGPAEHGPQRPGIQHDHHHDHHRPHRPVGSGGRGEYEDDHHHDCHHEHEHEHEHEHDHGHDYDHHHDHHRPHRPIRPGSYDDYGSGGRRPIGGAYRPDRPYHNRRDQSTPAPDSFPGEQSGSPSSGASSGSQGNSSGSNGGDSTIVRENETMNSGAERQANRGSERQVGGSPSLRRVPMFSPFDSLFGTLDDSLFGGLRSSFVDAPMKATSGEVVSRFDAIVNSPKISLPAAAPAASEQPDRKPESEPVAANPRSVSSDAAAKLLGGPVRPATDKREPEAKALGAPVAINRGGIRHFLLMI